MEYFKNIFVNQEEIFNQITTELLNYHAECQENENCGTLGNNEVNLYIARDLARKHDLKMILKTLCYDLEDDGITAEQYLQLRNRKLDELRTKNKLDTIKKNANY